MNTSETHIDSIVFNDNNLNGIIPCLISNLSHVNYVSIHRNQDIAINNTQTFFSIKSLLYAYFTGNGINIRLDDSLCNAVSLGSLGISYTINIDGNLPHCIDKLNNLYYISIAIECYSSSIANSTGPCKSNGSILAKELFFIKNLTFIQINGMNIKSIESSNDNNDNNRIDSYQFNITNDFLLHPIDLQDNKLTQIPHFFQNYTQLSSIYLPNNDLTGTIPILWKTCLRAVDISSNNLIVNVKIQHLVNWKNMNLSLNFQ